MRISRAQINRFMTLPVPAEGATHQEIAKALGCSKQRVQQIEAAALRKLASSARRLKILRELLESFTDERSRIY